MAVLTVEIFKFVPFRCKSRFCPSRGNKYNQLRSFHMSRKLVSCVHRHCEMESSYPLVHLFRKVKNEMYTRHEDNKTVTETIPALDFIQKLIVHIPEKHFKMLRYYGIYAKHHKQEKKLRKCISAKNNVSCVLFRIGSTPSFSLSDTPLSVVPSNVVLLCWF